MDAFFADESVRKLVLEIVSHGAQRAHCEQLNREIGDSLRWEIIDALQEEADNLYAKYADHDLPEIPVRSCYYGLNNTNNNNMYGNGNNAHGGGTVRRPKLKSHRRKSKKHRR